MLKYGCQGDYFHRHGRQFNRRITAQAAALTGSAAKNSTAVN